MQKRHRGCDAGNAAGERSQLVKGSVIESRRRHVGLSGKPQVANLMHRVLLNPVAFPGAVASVVLAGVC